MSRQERLFDAIGGVDEKLLERCEKKRVRRNTQRVWAAAALLALAFLVWTAMPKSPAVTSDIPVTPPPVDENPPMEPDSNEEIPPEAEGEYHFLQFQVEAEAPEVCFSIYIDKESYYSYEQDGTYVIRPRLEPENTPECKMEISHIAGTGLTEAMEMLRAQTAALYDSVEIQEDGAAGLSAAISPDMLYASNGTDWDDAQREILFAEDGSGGVFVFEISYFLEATEGHRARFMDMAGTFAPDSGEDLPGWIAELKDTSQRLMEAAFANDMEPVADLLAPDAWVEAYGEDVGGIASVGGFDYSIDAETGYTSAVVSVKHRLSAEEMYSYLTMKLSREDGRWKAEFIGLEK